MAEAAVRMLGIALHLRASWDKVLDRCLQRMAGQAGEEEETEAPTSAPEVCQLTHELLSFLKTEVRGYAKGRQVEAGQTWKAAVWREVVAAGLRSGGGTSLLVRSRGSASLPLV